MSDTPASAAAQQARQRAYYARTAGDYDSAHRSGFDEHQFALAWLVGVIHALGLRSVLDLGAGTGRALITLKAACPGLRVVGIEPSPELRAQGYARGLGKQELIDGDGRALAYPDCAFDLVCEFGALHHVPKPSRMVAEMLRVAREAVFVSDCNNFGQGGAIARAVKQGLNAIGLWRLADRIRTRGKGYHFSEGDGVFYSYSAFDNYAQIAAACRSVHVMNTHGDGRAAYRAAPTVALLGLKTTEVTQG